MSLYTKRCRNLLPVVAVLVAVAILGAPTQARADLQVSWSASTALLGESTTNGTISSLSNGSAGGFTISGNAAGAATLGATAMDLSSISISSSAGGTLTLYLTQNGLTSPTGLGTLTGTLTGHFITGSGSVSMVAYGNDTNLLYGNAAGVSPGGFSESGTTPASGGLTNVATGAISPGGSASTQFNATNPYSMTEIIMITFNSSGGTVSLSSDGSTTFSTPAPAGLVLLFSAVPCVGLGLWRRSRKA
jgi:hypothetical protein